MENGLKPAKISGSAFRFDSFKSGKVLYAKKKKRLPAMGWNSWNAFGSGNTEFLTKAMADKMVELGLDTLGYSYCVLDDGCYCPEREDGKLKNETEKFPSGFRALADYIHSKGLKFGMYNDIGTNLCAGAAVGTYLHEETDAQSYLDWGVDFIKVDNCYYMFDNATFSNPENARFVYTPSIKSLKLNASGKAIVLSAVNDAVITGKGIKKIAEGSNGDAPAEYVNNIGTFDGTNTGTTPVGDMSGELVFVIDVSESDEISILKEIPEKKEDSISNDDENISADINIEYATGREPGIGSWLQIAVDNANGSDLIYDDFVPESESKETFIWSDTIDIKLVKGINLIRVMNHRRQENTLHSYAELLKGFNTLDPNNEIILSICEWGKTQPQNWGYKVGDSWRILNDITFRVGWDGNPGIGRWFDPGTPSVTSQYNKAVVMDEFAGLDKGWNDPDMLMIGMDGLTDIQCKTHMTMWCMMNSPLMLGLDLRRVEKGDWIYKIIANKELIALNQDPLGIQAKRIYTTIESENPSKEYITNNNRVDILVKPLSDGSAAISFINVSEISKEGSFSISADDIPFETFIKGKKYLVTDLWTGKESENTTGTFEVRSLPACDNYTIRIKALD
ncbi:MAG: glycoside hydrolase family 27 protein [Lachnospiraceae bacterium]|nr:glycoside hydrolase family 27 protein [Lachnospiraceae bacterium]